MGELVSRQQHLGRFMRLLQRLADEVSHIDLNIKYSMRTVVLDQMSTIIL